METRLERRAFIGRLGVAGLAAVAAGVVTKAAHGGNLVPPQTARAARPPRIDEVVTVTPGAPLVIDGSVDLGAVHLHGGQIATTGGGVITIRYLRKV